MARPQTLSRKASSSKPSSSKALVVADPPISKKKPAEKGKKKKSPAEIHHVQLTEPRGPIFGFSSLDPATRYLMYPSSRDLHDLESVTPPHSPERDNIFTKVKSYRFDLPTFGTEVSEERYRKLESRKKPATLYPDMQALEEMQVEEDVCHILRTSGLSILLREDPGSYRDLIMEFMSSFEPVRRMRSLVAWRFQLGGIHWEVASDVLKQWFHFPDVGQYPHADAAVNIDDRVRHMCMLITSSEYGAEKSHKATAIHMRIWTLIHRFIACAFFARSDGGRFVSKIEIAIMSYMQAKEQVDWLEALTRGFESHLAKKCRNLALGGGSFITILARKLFFDLADGEAQFERLSILALQARHIVTKDLHWAKVFCEEGAADAEEEAAHDDGAHGNHPMADIPAPTSAFTSGPADIPSSSTQPPPSFIEARMDLVVTWLTTLSRQMCSMERTLLEVQAEIRAPLGSITSHLGTPYIPRPASPVPPPTATPPHTTQPPTTHRPHSPHLSSLSQSDLNNEGGEKDGKMESSYVNDDESNTTRERNNDTSVPLIASTSEVTVLDVENPNTCESLKKKCKLSTVSQPKFNDKDGEEDRNMESNSLTDGDSLHSREENNVAPGEGISLAGSISEVSVENPDACKNKLTIRKRKLSNVFQLDLNDEDGKKDRNMESDSVSDGEFTHSREGNKVAPGEGLPLTVSISSSVLIRDVCGPVSDGQPNQEKIVLPSL